MFHAKNVLEGWVTAVILGSKYFLNIVSCETEVCILEDVAPTDKIPGAASLTLSITDFIKDPSKFKQII